MTEKSMLIFAYNAIKQTEKDGINFPPLTDQLAYRKKNPKYSCVKVWIEWTYCGQR
jgi:hypothetical protein